MSTTKKKTAGANFRYNQLYRHSLQGDGKLANLLTDDSVLNALQQDMVEILGAIRAKTVGSGSTQIQKPNPFPVPLARWEGRLLTDTTTQGRNGQGNIQYTYDHQSAFRLNAEAFRDRVEEIVLYHKMETDLTNVDSSDNPGGTVAPTPGNPIGGEQGA